MDRRGDLLDSKGDEYANDNDPDLTGELTPAVQRFGNVEVHAAGPRRRSLGHQAPKASGKQSGALSKKPRR
jgi:hypothetical protein